MPDVFVELAIFTLVDGVPMVVLSPGFREGEPRECPTAPWTTEISANEVSSNLVRQFAPEARMPPIFAAQHSIARPVSSLLLSYFIFIEKVDLTRQKDLTFGNVWDDMRSFQSRPTWHDSWKMGAYSLTSPPMAPFVLSPEFTLSELQQAFEVVSGEPMDKRHFRRQVVTAKWLKETGNMTSGAHRPAKLYSLATTTVVDIRTSREPWQLPPSSSPSES